MNTTFSIIFWSSKGFALSLRSDPGLVLIWNRNQDNSGENPAVDFSQSCLRVHNFTSEARLRFVFRATKLSQNKTVLLLRIS